VWPAPCSGGRRRGGASTSVARAAAAAPARLGWRYGRGHRLVLTLQQADAARRLEGGQGARHRRYADGVVGAIEGLRAGAASDEARGIREEVGFSRPSARRSSTRPVTAEEPSGTGAAIQQMSAVRSSGPRCGHHEGGGVETPDISILSNAFLAEVRDAKHPNLASTGAAEADPRRRTLAGETERHQSKSCQRAAGSRIARYSHERDHDRAGAGGVDPASRRKIRAARLRGEESGLTEEEIEFYDALAGRQRKTGPPGHGSRRCA